MNTLFGLAGRTEMRAECFRMQRGAIVKRLMPACIALGSIVAAGTALGGIIPVSRTSTYSGEGHSCYYDNPNEPDCSEWGATDSCSTLGFWSPHSVGPGVFWHFSNAGVNTASFNAQAEIVGYSGHTQSYLDDQRTGYEYVFDVPYPTQVSIKGFGQVKLTSTAGFSLAGDAIPSAGATYALPPARYTIKDQFVNGHGQAYFEMRNLTCLGDIDNNARVDDEDFVLFAQSYDVLGCGFEEMPAGCPADLDANGGVDDADFVIFVSSYDNLVCP